jgi:hypothetical protein
MNMPINPRYQPAPKPERSPGSPASLAADLHHGHFLLMKAGAVANMLLEQSNVLTGGCRSESALAKLMAAQGLACLSARLGDRLHSVRRVCGRLAAKGIDPAIIKLPTLTAAQTPSAEPTRARLHAAPGQARGRLKNGNPAGDYLAAPRCGARSRSGCPCRQPAMANGRCRFHGGKSTGARTAEGLRRCRAIRFRHGGRSAPVIALRSRAVHAARHLRQVDTNLRLALVSAGHGVDRPDSCFRPESSASTVGAPPCGRPIVGGIGRPRGAAPTSRTFRDHLRLSASICGSTPSFAGHGVDRSVFDFPAARPAALARAG